MRTKRISGIALGVLAAASLNLAATAPAGAATEAADSCVTNTFTVKSTDSKARWSMYGDLYAGDGKHVHHWQEIHKEGKGEVKWPFKYCGDRGWAHLWIYTANRSKPTELLGLTLDESACWQISRPNGGSDVNNC